MLRVTDAYVQRGWSSVDHLIDDSKIERLIGRTYRTWAQLRRAAEAASGRLGFAAVEYVDLETGDRWLRGTEPPLPGREPLRRLIREGQE